jgi:hypothetical protein
VHDQHLACDLSDNYTSNFIVAYMHLECVLSLSLICVHLQVGYTGCSI